MDEKSMYGTILRQLRETTGRSQAEVARSVGISAAKLARLEANQRGLSVEDFVRITETLGERPGNLLPNDLGDIGHLKPLIDRIASVPPRSLAAVATIIEQAVLLAEQTTAKSPAKKERPNRNRSRRAARKARR
jgi:transcriptional regulator with XRE-family HTH domain